MKVLVLAVLLCVVTAAPQGAGPGVWVTYSIENHLVTPYFDFTITVKVPKGASFFDVMEEAAMQDSHFAMTHIPFGPFTFITSINGLYFDGGNEYYWIYVIRDKQNGDCVLPLGVDNYKPEHWGHIVFIYMTLNTYTGMTECDLITKGW